jgi:ABC-type bacteriocin/lantibiotic exporter with double-glycine peptidase domain
VAATPSLRRPTAALALVVLGALAGCATWGKLPEDVQRDPGWLTAPGVRAFAQQGTRDCGAAALTTMLDHWDPGLDLETVRRLTGPPDAQGLTAARLRAVARDRGLNAYLISGSLEDLDRELGAGRPVLIGLVRTHGRTGLTHYEVVAGRNAARGLVLVADPERGWTVTAVDKFLAEWEPARRLTLIVSR